MLRVLKRGNYGNDVRKLQRELNGFHFKVGRGLVTGYFGAKTQDAVRRFQSAFGIAVDGLVGPNTYKALAKNGRLSPHFTVFEFYSRGNGNLILDRKLIEKLEKLRSNLNVPIKIVSGYRDPRYNRKVGGAPKSQHLRGTAADIVVAGYSVKEVGRRADQVGFNGIGLYRSQNFVHVDVRGWKARW